MRIMGILLGLAAMAPAWAGDIVEVLERSQRMRLESRVPAPDASERTARVRASFAQLLAASPPPRPVQLRVMEGGVQAEAMLGHLLVVGEAVGDLPEPERLLLMAHELGHLHLDHWLALAALYRRHIPGEVRPETTDPVAGALGRDAHELSYRHEYEADAFGYALTRRLGVGLDDVVSLLMRQPMMDSATHPASRRRLAQLRALDLRLSDEARLADNGAPSLEARGPGASAGTR